MTALIRHTQHSVELIADPVERFQLAQDTPRGVRFEYLIGEMQPNYPVPAIRVSTFDSLYELGYVSALNDFDLDAVYNLLRR